MMGARPSISNGLALASAKRAIGDPASIVRAARDPPRSSVRRCGSTKAEPGNGERRSSSSAAPLRDLAPRCARELLRHKHPAIQARFQQAGYHD